jgi:hypothetical protein
MPIDPLPVAETGVLFPGGSLHSFQPAVDKI